MFSLLYTASKTPQMGQIVWCSRHEMDRGRGSGSPRQVSAGSTSIPRVCPLPFGAPCPAGMVLVALPFFPL